LAIDDGYALIAYRRRSVWLKLENENRLCRSTAGSRSGRLRFRAPSSFREIIRQVATDPNRTKCYYLDLDAVLASLSERAAPVTISSMNMSISISTGTEKCASHRAVGDRQVERQSGTRICADQRGHRGATG